MRRGTAACAPSENTDQPVYRAVWSESSHDTLWVSSDPKHLQADSEDSDQTALVRRLIWDFAVRTSNPVGNAVSRLKLYM